MPLVVKFLDTAAVTVKVTLLLDIDKTLAIHKDIACQNKSTVH